MGKIPVYMSNLREHVGISLRKCENCRYWGKRKSLVFGLCGKDGSIHRYDANRDYCFESENPEEFEKTEEREVESALAVFRERFGDSLVVVGN